MSTNGNEWENFQKMQKEFAEHINSGKSLMDLFNKTDLSDQLTRERDKNPPLTKLKPVDRNYYDSTI